MDAFVTKHKRQRTRDSSNSSEELEEGPQVFINKESASSRQKSYEETRLFMPQWTEEYFFVLNASNKPVCLLCQETLSCNKKSNIKRHFDAKHSNSINEKYPPKSDSRNNYIQQLQNKINRQQSMLKKSLTESECVSFASLKITMLIAKSLRPFAEGEFLKQVFIDSSEILFKEFKNKDSILRQIQNLQLSHQSIQRRMIALYEDINLQAINILRDCESFSLALDESTDITDISQLCVWFRSTDKNFNIFTNILAVKALHGRTQGEDIFKVVSQVISDFSLNMSKCVMIATDGAPNMTGKEIGVITLLRNSGESLKNLLGLHCIIHIESLCAKMGLSKLNDTILSVSKIINYIRSRALVHRQFKNFLERMDSNYSDLLLYTEVRWLSRGRMSGRFFELIPEIKQFFESMGILNKFENLSDNDWILRVAFICDISAHLNDLNTQLQGKENLLIDSISKITAFQRKLRVYIEQFEQNDYINFTKFSTCQMPDEFSPLFYIEILDKLIEEFDTRFNNVQFKLLQSASKFIEAPYNCTLEELKQLSEQFNGNYKLLQNELIELQSETEKHGLSVIEFWKTIKYENLRKISLQVLSCFSSTYCCESTFSSMKILKSKLRTSLLDDSFESQLVCAVTSIEPRYIDMIQANDFRVSH